MSRNNQNSKWASWQELVSQGPETVELTQIVSKPTKSEPKSIVPETKETPTEAKSEALTVETPVILEPVIEEVPEVIEPKVELKPITKKSDKKS